MFRARCQSAVQRNGLSASRPRRAGYDIVSGGPASQSRVLAIASIAAEQAGCDVRRIQGPRRVTYISRDFDQGVRAASGPYMSSKPLIGVPSDRRVLDPHPFHMVGEKYLSAVRDGADALPFMIPALGESLDPDALLSRIDGLLLTGSPSNVEPHHYDGEPSRPGTLHDPHRDDTTLRLIDRALEIGMPLFAICRGYQELNVVLGGSLHQHVEEQPGYHDHRENPDDPLDVQYGPSHEVHLVEGGMLYRLAGNRHGDRQFAALPGRRQTC